MKTIYSLLIALIFSSCLFAQDDIKIFTNALDIDESKYKDIKGSPYLFENWVNGKVVGMNGQDFDNVLLNLNVHTQNFEARNDQKYIILDESTFNQVVIYGKQENIAKEMTFEKNTFKAINNNLMQVVFGGEKLQLLKYYRCDLNEREVNATGKKEVFKRFHLKESYAIVKEGELSPLKINKKKVIEILGHKKAIESFLEKKRLKLDSEKSLVKVLDFYADILMD